MSHILHFQAKTQFHIWATLVWKSWCLNYFLKMWNDKTSSISIYSYTFKSHLLLYECSCISPSLPTVHLPGQQQRSPTHRRTAQQHMADRSLVPPSAGSHVNIILTSKTLRLDLPWTSALTHPRSQQSVSFPVAKTKSPSLQIELHSFREVSD